VHEVDPHSVARAQHESAALVRDRQELHVGRADRRHGSRPAPRRVAESETEVCTVVWADRDKGTTTQTARRIRMAIEGWNGVAMGPQERTRGELREG